MKLNYKKLLIGKKINKILIFIHGFGANGQDLLALAKYFEAVEKNFIAIAPNAPYKHNMSDNSYYWFSLDIWEEKYLYNQMKKSMIILQEFIDYIKQQYQLNEDNIILCGFSQGSLLAIHFALENRKKVSFCYFIFWRCITIN